MDDERRSSWGLPGVLSVVGGNVDIGDLVTNGLVRTPLRLLAPVVVVAVLGICACARRYKRPTEADPSICSATAPAPWGWGGIGAAW